MVCSLHVECVKMKDGSLHNIILLTGIQVPGQAANRTVDSSTGDSVVVDVVVLLGVVVGTNLGVVLAVVVVGVVLGLLVVVVVVVVVVRLGVDGDVVVVGFRDVVVRGRGVEDLRF